MWYKPSRNWGKKLEEQRSDLLSAGGQGDYMSNPRGRYFQILHEVKKYAFETAFTLVFLALLTDFTLKELHPIAISIWYTLHAP
jgi:hypothetical protein